jgi:hypothetical protein
MRSQATKISKAKRNARFGGWCVCLAALAPLAGGCSHDRTAPHRDVAVVGVAAPEPPFFLTGPISVLLTNSEGWSARVLARNAAGPDPEKSAFGELLCQGSRLHYAPSQEEPQGQHAPAGGFSYVWDVAQNRGYLLSETLQGFTPLTGKTQVTNLIETAAQARPEKIEGHRCKQQEVLVKTSDGGTAVFRVWQAADLKGLPVRISSVTTDLPTTLTFSRIRLGPPAGESFEPPAGFTKYDSPSAMIDELAIRDRNFKRKLEP